MPERPHERAEGVRGRHGSVGVHAQDLAPRLVGELLGRGGIGAAVADHHVELAVGTEREATAVVIRARPDRGLEQHASLHGSVADDAEPEHLVPQRAADGGARDVDVEEPHAWPTRVQGDAEGASFPGAVHARDAMEQPVVTGSPVQAMDLARGALQIDDASAGSEREPDGLVELGDGHRPHRRCGARGRRARRDVAHARRDQRDGGDHAPPCRGCPRRTCARRHGRPAVVIPRSTLPPSVRRRGTMAPVTTVPPSAFGVPALRSEDPRFLAGRGRYLENLPIEGAVRAVFVRSIMPHARVVAVQAEDARAMPGVVGVFTAADFDLDPLPPSGNVEGADGVLDGPFGREVLAHDVVRFVGETVAVVVAESLGQAEDAAETVLVELDPLPVVTDVEAAIADEAPLLWPGHGSNVASTFSTNWDDDVLEGADVVARGRFVNQRVAPVPMEGNGDRGRSSRGRDVHGLGLDPGPVRRAERPRGRPGGRPERGAHDRAGRRRRVRRQAPDLSGVHRRGRGRPAARQAGAMDRVSLRRAPRRSPMGARRCSSWRSAPRATARSWASAPTCSPTWARTRSGRSCPTPRKRCSPACMRSPGSPPGDAAWSRTRRLWAPTAGRAVRRRRR